MYGTIGHFRVKAGMGEQLLEVLRQVGNLHLPGSVAAYCYENLGWDWCISRQLHLPGSVAAYCCRPDVSAQDYYIAVVFSSREAYFAHAQHPDVVALDNRLMELLESEPEWHDGEIVYVGPPS